MPSVRGHWMLDSAEDGASWIWRLTSHENKHTTQGRTRQAWVSLLEDLGLDYQFVTPEMIRAGALASPSLAALVLPRSIALSDAEAVAIQSFAMRGNLVCADAQAGLFNENLMRRRVGCLDALFGIKRSTSRTRLKTGRVRAPAAKAIPYPVSEPDLRPTTASVHGEAGQTPILLTAKFGSGTALYLNLLVMDYARDRLQAPPRAAWLRNELRRRLLMAGLRPRVHLVRKPDAPSWPVAARLRKVPGGYVLAFHLNVTTGGAAVPWKKIPTDTVVELEARLWKSFNIRNLDSGASLGRLRRFPVRVSASRPAFFQLFSKKP